MLRYHRRIDDLTSGRLRWGILTNGTKWRLYWAGARSVSEEFLEIDPRFANRVFMVHKTANRAPGADLAVEVVPLGSELAEKFNLALKEVEKRKYRRVRSSPPSRPMGGTASRWTAIPGSGSV